MKRWGRWLFWGLALTTLGLCGVREVVAQSDPLAKKYALLVGVDKYEHAGMNGAEPLKYAVADVRELGQLLKGAGYEIELLQGAQAKLAAIQEKLKLIKSKGNAEGVVLVALAGHGVQFEKDDDAYYCPYDADMREAYRNDKKVLDRSGRPIQEPTPETCLKLTDILDQFGLAKAGTRILLADCCRNDPTTGRGRGVGSSIKTDRLPGNTALMLSCSQGQKSYEDDRWKHGAFFFHVLRGLREGHATVSRLDAYLEESVPADVRDLRDAPHQTPFTLKAASKLDFGIGRGAGLAKLVTNSIGMELILIPAGDFLMGSPPGEPERGLDNELQHDVRITKPFYMGKYEVTQAEYAAVMGTNPSYFSREGRNKNSVAGLNTGRFPVDSVSWEDATEFCRRLGLTEGKKRRRIGYRRKPSGNMPAGQGRLLPFILAKC